MLLHRGLETMPYYTFTKRCHKAPYFSHGDIKQPNICLYIWRFCAMLYIDKNKSLKHPTNKSINCISFFDNCIYAVASEKRQMRKIYIVPKN